MVTLTLLLLIAEKPSPPSDSGYFSPAQVRKFAEYLFEQGDYLRAAGEFQRYMLLTDATDDPELLFAIGRCYLLGNNPERARKYLLHIEGDRKEDAVYEVAKSYYQEGKYRESIEYIKTTGYQDKQRFHTLLIKNYLLLREFPIARHLIRQNPTGTQLDGLTLTTERLRYKNPAAAGLLSALLPGLGKFYAGRWGDGVFSIMVVGITGWQTYDGFHREGKKSVKGWVYGTLCLGFHAGNIWGAVVAAKQHNRKIEDDIIKKVTLLDSLEHRENKP